LRHPFFDRALQEGETVDYVLEHFADANFDPEFYPQYEQEIVNQFNREQNTQIQLKKKNWKRIFSNTP